MAVNPSFLAQQVAETAIKIRFVSGNIFISNGASLILILFLPNPAEEQRKTSFPLRSSLCTYSGFYLFVVIESISAVTAFIAVFTNANISAR